MRQIRDTSFDVRNSVSQNLHCFDKKSGTAKLTCIYQRKALFKTPTGPPRIFFGTFGQKFSVTRALKTFKTPSLHE